MIRTTLLVFCIVITGAVAAQSTGKTSTNPVRRVISAGTDGDQTFYNVTCRDESVGSIVVYGEKQEVCVIPQGGTERCKSPWALQRAARASCGG